jgi:hypothetical protein
MEISGRRSFASLRIPTLLEVLAVVGFSFIYGVIIVRNSTFAVAMIGGLLLFSALVSNPLRAMALLLLIVPFSQMPIFKDSVFDAPGARPFLMLGALVGFVTVLNIPKAKMMPRLGMNVSAVLLLFFAVTVVRALPNIEIIGFGTEEVYTPTSFFLSFLVKPLVYFMPLVVVGLFVKTAEDIGYVVRTIILSLVLFSAWFLYYYTFNVSDKGNIELAWEYAGTALGLQKNQAAAFYTIGFPIFLAHFYAKRDKLSLLGIALGLPAAGYLYSRTTYVALMISVPAFLFLTRRFKSFPVLILLGLLLAAVVSDTIIERFSHGFESGDLEEISAGRLEHQWIPISVEYLANPTKLLFGAGKYGVFSTEAYARGFLPGATHPHNMYLETIVDAGLIGFVPILFILLYVMKKAYDHMKSLPAGPWKDYQAGAVVSLFSYFLGGMTRGSLWPVIENSFVYAIIGLSIVIMVIAPRGEQSGSVQGELKVRQEEGVDGAGAEKGM